MTKQEFSGLVTQYERLVYTICFQLVQNAAAAEDLTQETFLAAYLHQDRCPAGYERQWLGRIAANKAKDYLQSAWMRRTTLPGDEEIPAGLSPPAEELVLGKLSIQAVRAAIEALPEPYGDVCQLCLLSECTAEEAARRLKRPVKTIYTQLNRGKKLLRMQLSKEGRL